jgi:ATP-binding protein involved in chromosome partitioning
MALEAARACAPAGAVLVAANSDQRQDALFRVKGLLDQLGVSVFGLLENLAGLNCPSCGRRQQAFPKVGARVAQEMGVPLLGEIPVELPADPAAPRRPALLAAPNGEVAHAFLSAAGKLAAEVSKRNFAPSLSSAPAADPPASDQKDP